MINNTDIPTLAERLHRFRVVVRRRKLILLLVTVAATVAAVVVASASTAQYGATSKLVLAATQLIGLPPSTPTVANADPQRDITTKISLITAPSVAAEVNSQLRLHMSIVALLAEVRATAEATSNVVDVTATDRSPSRAIAIANAFSEDYVNYRLGIARSSLEQAVTSVHHQLSLIGSAGGKSPQAAALGSELRQLRLAADTQSAGAIVVGPANFAIDQSPHAPLVAGLAGALAGLLLASALIALLELTDRTLRDAEQIATSGFKVRVLAEIPRARLPRRGSVLAGAGRSQTEAFDSLAGKLLLASRRRALRSVMVTSPGAGDGKTTVTLGLARALQRLERSVLIIETGGQTSVLDGNPQLQAGSGLRGIVTGTSTVGNELIDLSQMVTDNAQGEARSNPGSRISVLPMGTGELSAYRLLSGHEMANVIAEGRELADYVLIDGPSTHQLPRALAWIDEVEAALMVGRLRWTNADSLHDGLENLNLLGVRLLGLVLTGTIGGRDAAPRVPRNGAIVPFEQPSDGGTAAARRASVGRTNSTV